MEQNINKNSSDREQYNRMNMADSVQVNSLSPDDMAQKNKERQQEQTRYLNRILEAYGDCV